MDEVHDNRLRMVKVGARLLLALAALVYVYHYGRSIDQSFPSRNFTVDGKGEVNTTPDIATFAVTVTSEGGKDVAAVQKMNTDKMNAVNAFLKDSGIATKDLKTMDYNLVPRYSNTSCFGGVCPPVTTIGYTLTQTLSVKVRDTAKIGDLLTGVVEKGANTVSGVQFVLDDD
ncbi:MAG: SIMPL domain-containing protein, partial [Candidatus Moraniibacteriota bacterium]